MISGGTAFCVFVKNKMFKLSFSFFRLAGNNDLVPRGSLIGNSGDIFYITNTHCLLTLSGENIVNNDADGALLRVVGNSASRGWAPPAATAHRSNSPQTVRRFLATSSSIPSRISR